MLLAAGVAGLVTLQQRANGTVLTLILVPGTGEPPRDEELAVRRLDARTAEICCVPFLQMRLALGDVVRVDARGYAGEVIRPSGRVTFAVRHDGPAPELPGVVTEEIGPGRLAVAAGEEQAREVHELLRQGERAGRLEYRSLLRWDKVDSPLL